VDAVITTSAGYPLDLTYYQSIKAITAASHILKPGGRILLLAACQEGAGAPEFSNMLLAGESETAFLDRIADAPVIVDQWQLEKLALVTRRSRVWYYVPGLPAEYRSKLWGRCCASAEAAVREFTDGLAPGSAIGIIPEGPYVLAKTRAAV